jgi:hypothetical protein
MPIDVYADDEALRGGATSKAERGARFSVVADADPDVLLRIAAVLNLLNVAPRALQLEAAGEIVTVLAFMDGCTESQADHVARKLRQLTCVHSVELLHPQR